MNAHRSHWLIATLALVCFLLAAWTVPAEAQKKQKPKTQQKEVVKETPKAEVKDIQEEDTEKSEEVAVASASSSGGSLPNKFLDVIKQYTGKKTNLGTLKKFAGDYMVFEDDLTTILVPLNNIQSVKLVKDDETSPAQLEIKLISRD